MQEGELYGFVGGFYGVVFVYWWLYELGYWFDDVIENQVNFDIGGEQYGCLGDDIEFWFGVVWFQFD